MLTCVVMFHRVDNSPSLVDGDIDISLCNNQILNLEQIYLPPPERVKYYKQN